MEVRRGVAGPRPFSVPAAPGELEPAGSCGAARPGPARPSQRFTQGRAAPVPVFHSRRRLTQIPAPAAEAPNG